MVDICLPNKDSQLPLPSSPAGSLTDGNNSLLTGTRSPNLLSNHNKASSSYPAMSSHFKSFLLYFYTLCQKSDQLSHSPVIVLWCLCVIVSHTQHLCWILGGGYVQQK